MHIGSGKTGSSSIQAFFRDNRERLANLGYLYPRTPGNARHIQLGMFIKSDEDLEASIPWQRRPRRQREPGPAAFRANFRRSLLAEIEQSGLSRVVFSDESLYDQADDLAVKRLRRLTDEVATSLRLVVYLRRQDDHLISRYQQRIQNGTEIRRLDEFARQDSSLPYDYDARLRSWELLMQPDQFVVRRFEKGSFIGDSLVADFLDAAGMDVRVEDFELAPRENESLDAESVEFLRLFNLYRIESAGVPLSYVRDLAKRSPFQQPVKIDNRKVVTRLREATTGPILTLPEDVLDDFMARWAAGNRAVAHRYLGGGELFHMPRRTANTTIEQHLDPARLDHFLCLIQAPEEMHEPVRRLVEREAQSPLTLHRRTRPRFGIRRGWVRRAARR